MSAGPRYRPWPGWVGALGPRQMPTLAHVVGLANPSGELLVHLLTGGDPEVVHEQAFGVGHRTQDPRVIDQPLQIQIPDQPTRGGPGTGEPPPAALERDRGLGHGVGERPARPDKLHEPLVELHEAGRLVT